MVRGPEQVSTGVPGLDDMVGGGYLRGDATLVGGSPGTGKTTLGLQFLAAGVARGEPGLFVTFEYLPQQLYRDAAAKGMALQAWEQQGKVRVVCTTPDVLLQRGDEGRTLLDELVQELGARRVVIDAMNHFELPGKEARDLRAEVGGLMNHLRMLGVSAVVTHEIPQIVGPAVIISTYGLEFLADNVILLRFVELEGELRKAVNVLKFRGGDHDRKYRSYQLTARGMVVESPLTGLENITGGTARRSLEERARSLI